MSKMFVDQWNKTYTEIECAIDNAYALMCDRVVDDADNASGIMEEAIMKVVNRFNEYVKENYNDHK